MKKVVPLILICLVFISVGCFKKLTGYQEISFEEYQKLREDKETFPLVIGSATCSACAMYKGTMENFITKYQVEVKYIDIDKLSEEEYQKLKVDTSFSSTPTTVFVENGEYNSYYNRLVGAEDINEVIKAFKENNYIK